MTVLCHLPQHHVLLSDLRSITVYDDAPEIPKCARVVTIEPQSQKLTQEQAQATQVFSFLHR
jgi:hypothetical protein